MTPLQAALFSMFATLIGLTFCDTYYPSIFAKSFVDKRHPEKTDNIIKPQKEPKHEFQLVQLGSARRDHFLLDKKTGRVWERVCDGKIEDNGLKCNGRIVWDQMIVLDSDGNVIK
jgi:hypothetical protein